MKGLFLTPVLSAPGLPSGFAGDHLQALGNCFASDFCKHAVAQSDLHMDGPDESAFRHPYRPVQLRRTAFLYGPMPACGPFGCSMGIRAGSSAIWAGRGDQRKAAFGTSSTFRW